MFDSKAEARRYQTLSLLEQAGDISDIRVQVRYDLKCNGVRLGFYKSDFEYNDKDGNHIVEDVKGSRSMVTAVFRLKKRIVKAQYGVDIQEVYDS
jgi:hypothetical protein